MSVDPESVFHSSPGDPDALARLVRGGEAGAAGARQVTLICRASTAHQACCLIGVSDDGNPSLVARAVGGSVFGHRSAIAVYTLPSGFSCPTRDAGTLSDFGCTCQP